MYSRIVWRFSDRNNVLNKRTAARLNDHLVDNHLNETFQSAYRALHSTETALLKVKNDIMCALDQRRAVFVVLLDLSAAFDTVDYHIFLKRLSDTFCIKDTALHWFSSYLQGRRNRVVVSGSYSCEHIMDYGLPQGSVIGPMGFSLYTHPLGEVIRRHHVNYHMYADDTQLYVDFDPTVLGEKEKALNILTSCIDDIIVWMRRNKLKLNAEKTEFFVAASKNNLSHVQDVSLIIGNSTVTPSTSIRNLCVSHVCQSCQCHLKSIQYVALLITICATLQ